MIVFLLIFTNFLIFAPGLFWVVLMSLLCIWNFNRVVKNCFNVCLQVFNASLFSLHCLCFWVHIPPNCIPIQFTEPSNNWLSEASLPPPNWFAIQQLPLSCSFDPIQSSIHPLPNMPNTVQLLNFVYLRYSIDL